MRRIVLTMTVLLATVAPAAATINQQIHENQTEIACGGAIRSASLLMTLAQADPDSKTAATTKDFNDYAKDCPSARYVNAGNGWVSFSQAIVLHRTGGAWQSALDTAIADFTKCQSDFSGERLSTPCQTSLQNALKDKTDWAAAGPAAAASAKP